MSPQPSDPAPITAPSSVSRVTTKVKEYTKFWADHVKKGEVPWTQWYCCGVAANGKECEHENHRIHKACKKCCHRVCDNCVKGGI